MILLIRIASLVSLLGVLSCASKYVIPKQTFHGYVGTLSEIKPLEDADIKRWRELPRTPPGQRFKLLILHAGLDQVPNYQFHALQMDLVDELLQFRDALKKSDRVSDIELVGLPLWDARTTEDLRRIGVLYNARYILTMSVSYDLNSFYSQVGHFMGWIPYINFVAPIYKLEASMRADVVLFDVVTGGFVLSEAVRGAHRARSNSWFIQEHYGALAKKIHIDVFQALTARLMGWLHG